MPVFPSGDWMTAFCDALRVHPEAGDVAGALDGVYRFVVEPSGPLAERHAYDVAIRPGATSPDATLNGSAPAIAWTSAADAAPTIALTATYDRWRQLITGELDIGLAVMLRRIQVTGEVSRLLSQMSKTQPLRDALRSVDTQWLGG